MAPTAPRGRRRARIVAAYLAVLSILAGAPAAHAVQSAHAVIVSEDPADFTPNVLNGRVYAITVVGPTVVAGGVFANVAEPGGPTLPRTNLFAFDAATGAISTAFAPGMNGIVRALATDGTSVFVGGDFSKLKGTASLRLAKLDINGNKVPGFAATVTGSGVYDLTYRGGLLYVAGAFTAVNGVPRSGLAVLDPTTGSLIPGVDVPFTGLHNGGISRVAKLDVSPNGSTLVAVGNFTTVAGQPREQIAILDLAGGSATLSSWSTQRFMRQCGARFDTYIRDVDISPDGSYFVVGTTGGFFGGSNVGALCDTATRWEIGRTGSDQQPSWIDYSGGDTTWSIASTGSAIYVGGHFRWWNNSYAGDTVGPGTIRRRGIAALDPVNGLPFTWNPGRKLGEGVFSLVATDQGLWVGNDTDVIGGETHERLAFFPVAGGTTVPVHQPATLPGTLWSLSSNGSNLTSWSFDGTTIEPGTDLATSVDWTHARGAFLANGKLFTGWDDGKMYVRTFDGVKLGRAKPVYLNGLSPTYFAVANVTGMFLENGRLYYTVAGDDRLFMRYFSIQSQVVGSVTHVVSGTGNGFVWGEVRGMTQAGNAIYLARTDGNLYRVGWSAGAPVPASQTLLDASGAWAANGLFLRNP